MHLPRSWAVLVCVLALLIINLMIAGPLLGVEYSAYHGSVEGLFVAIARVMAEHPGEWNWWPLWSGGMPFENTYLPLTEGGVAGFSVLTGCSPARSFHIVTAAFYVLGAAAVFWMALAVSRRLAVSFVAALAYSCFSPSALLAPTVWLDAGGALNLHRLQALVCYGEAPHTVALVLLPVAVVCFSRALTTNAVKWKILAGVSAASIALSNAFGIVTLAIVLLCWLLSFPSKPWWRAPSMVAVIGVVSYCWISPWLSPGMIRAMRINSPTAGGDYRYTAASWIALAVFSGGFILLWFGLRRAKIASHLQFFTLFAYVPTVMVVIWNVWKVAVIAQPNRYELEMDMALLLAVVFGAAAILDRLPKSLRATTVVIVTAALGFQTVHSVRYARRLIRSVDPTQLVEYRIAKWMDEHRRGERAFISGSSSFLYNVFTNNPQLHGGHDPFVPNPFIRTVAFTIYSGMNAGARDAEYSVFWLKAFGAHAISVSGANGREFYKPFANPRKFEGVLPVLWREGDDTIYEVPSRSASLAHVIPRTAVVTRTPVHGLDIEPVESYVAALDDPRYPPATFQWKGMSQAEIRAVVDRGQVIAVEVTYAPGWEAYSDGKRQPVRPDAIGLMVIEPDCNGPCEISLRYTGGTERVVTRALSLTAMIAAAAFGCLGRRRRSNSSAR